MRESRRTFLSALGIYAAGSWVVLQVVDVLKQNLGLPPWAFSLALTLLLIGLPVVLATAWLQGRAQRREAESSVAESARRGPAAHRGGTGVRRLFTWRNAVIGGLGAMSLWGVVATGWLLRERSATEEGGDAAPGTAAAEGSTGVLVVRSRPEGAPVEARPVVSASEAELGPATALGTTPIEGVRVPEGEVVLRLGGGDLAPLTLLVRVSGTDTANVDAELLPDAPLIGRMVVVPEGVAPPGAGGVPVAAFLLDRHEVTNRDYGAFMADQGYATPSFWPDTLLVAGERLARPEALARLSDATGATGPRTWSGSVFPAGRGDEPVTGVSWYEARAYCLWQGKRLPTLAQWWRGAVAVGDRPYPWGDDGETLRSRANFEASGPAAVESLPLGVSPFGAFEMAGNVREWVRPGADDAGVALSVGGSWQDPVYTFSVEWQEELPLGFANETTGFRCARHAG